MIVIGITTGQADDIPGRVPYFSPISGEMGRQQCPIERTAFGQRCPYDTNLQCPPQHLSVPLDVGVWLR